MQPDSSNPAEPSQTKTDLQLPVNLAAERECLGSIIEDETLFNEVNDLRAADFASNDHQRVFEALLELREEHAPVDFLIVADRLGNRPEDLAMLSDLIQGCVLVRGHIRHHALIVLRKSRLRQLVRVGEWLSQTAAENNDPAQLARLAIEKLEVYAE